MKYTVISEFDEEDFTRQVQDHLSRGWQLQGGVHVTPYTALIATYYQAMYLEE